MHVRTIETVLSAELAEQEGLPAFLATDDYMSEMYLLIRGENNTIGVYTDAYDSVSPGSYIETYKVEFRDGRWEAVDTDVLLSDTDLANLFSGLILRCPLSRVDVRTDGKKRHFDGIIAVNADKDWYADPSEDWLAEDDDDVEYEAAEYEEIEEEFIEDDVENCFAGFSPDNFPDHSDLAASLSYGPSPGDAYTRIEAANKAAKAPRLAVHNEMFVPSMMGVTIEDDVPDRNFGPYYNRGYWDAFREFVD